MRNSSYSSPPGPIKHLAAHTAQPGSLPKILQQTLRPGHDFSCPGPWAGPRDLIVLKHSSYHQIFQYPLSLVSDLHIFWNTLGCSLCSSDELGVSLVLRASGLRSHLSRSRPATSQLFTLTSHNFVNQMKHRKGNLTRVTQQPGCYPGKNRTYTLANNLWGSDSTWGVRGIGSASLYKIFMP